MNACRDCAFHRVDKDNKYYHWCAKDGEDRFHRANKQVDGYGCACTSFKEKGTKTMYIIVNKFGERMRQCPEFEYLDIAEMLCDQMRIKYPAAGLHVSRG